MYTVTVLTPKGRRQQVKVTPNTTILQILEEVCTKHGLNPQDYDLRHHNKILDVSAMFRFTNLPNNAQLEMTEALKHRPETPVTVGIQFETGERLTGVFKPSESIWNIIISLKPEEEESNNLVAIYMRNEIFGVENLKKTTLRSLGLTSGRAMIRLLHKSPEELRVQANVSTSLPHRVPSEKSGEKGKKSSKSPEASRKETRTEKNKSPSPESAKKKTPPPESSPKDTKKSEGVFFGGSIFENLLRSDKSKKALLESRNNSGSDLNVHFEDTKGRTSPETKVKIDAVSKQELAKGAKEESKAILLGERNAVAYNLDSVKPVEFEEEPDDFFELTVHDAQLLLKQAKQLCADLENAPLMTAAQREFERDKKVLSLLHQYKRTVLRVTFPDRTVLQGTFAPLETVSAVEKFVSEYLESPKPPFYLYTTPPKVILKSDTRLIECGCVPSCVLYFGLPPGVNPPTQYLKDEVLEKLSSPSAAALHAYEARGIDKKSHRDYLDDSDPEKRKWARSVNSSEAGPSGSQQWDDNQRNPGSSPQFKVPKWYKANK